jgi:hypothetical protein
MSETTTTRLEDDNISLVAAAAASTIIQPKQQLQRRLRPTEEAYAELQEAYDFYNENLFDGQLPPCLITFQRQKRTFGYFSKGRFGRHDGVATTDEIAMNPAYFAVVPMIEVLQTLVHEMTHLWQSHFGNPSRACYHNAEWGSKMEAIGLMPSSTGMPGGKRTGQQMMDYVITNGPFDRVTRKLIKNGFAITWLDRFPEQPPSKYAQENYTTGTSSVSFTSDNGGSTAVIVDDGDNDDDSGVSSLLNSNPWVPPSLANPDIVQTIQSGNRSNRERFTCTGCQANAWGKPSLHLICGNCMQKMLLPGDELKIEGN